ncbi:MAG: SagB/ThcOx family dehydrogenase [Bacteroidetes bacterium]|nr:SagB/ThcOx family dehydrogenase [Bacteroidota bacterium]
MHPAGAPRAQPAQSVELPTPDRTGTMSVERALNQRRSVRAYQGEAMTLDDVSQLLWAAQGITHANGYRTAPSAGALYPIELHVVAGRVEGLAPGVYRYRPGDHLLVATERRDRRADLARAALGQPWVQAGAIAMVITAVYERTARKYGGRAPRYAHIEAGHVAQNIYLQATARNLGTVIVGAFDDADVKAVLNLPDGEEPLAIMPVGRRQR